MSGDDQSTGRIETVNCVDWNFGWHITYNYATDVQPLLPKGTVMHITTWHDNTAANKWNPDPTNWVGYGQRSSDDMAFAAYQLVPVVGRGVRAARRGTAADTRRRPRE